MKLLKESRRHVQFSIRQNDNSFYDFVHCTDSVLSLGGG